MTLLSSPHLRYSLKCNMPRPMLAKNLEKSIEFIVHNITKVRERTAETQRRHKDTEREPSSAIQSEPERVPAKK